MQKTAMLGGCVAGDSSVKGGDKCNGTGGGCVNGGQCGSTGQVGSCTETHAVSTRNACGPNME